MLAKKFLPVLFLALISILILTGKYECPIRKFTGIPCPACGMSRALICFLKLDFKSSLHFHPMLIFIIPAIILAYAQEFYPRLKNKFVNSFIFFTAISFFIVYIIRLMTNSIP